MARNPRDPDLACAGGGAPLPSQATVCRRCGAKLASSYVSCRGGMSRRGDGLAKPTVDRDRWRSALAAAGLTQNALAARLGISREVLSRYVTGTNRMPAEVLMRCARELGVSAESLWRG